MDLITLDDNHQAAKLVENYDSLIWTERYHMGDFQLTTGDVDRFMDILPEGTVVSLRETDVPMIVETHLIERKKNTPTKLTIKGRDFCSILDRRASIKAVAAGSADWNVVAKIPSDVAHYIINQICVLGVAAVEDIFPPDVVQFLTPSDYLTSTGPNRSFAVPRGNLLSTVMTMLQTEAPFDASTTPDTPIVEPHGIRAIRPDLSGTAVGVEIYLGQDRINDVRFDAQRELLDDGSYLFSHVGSATTAYVIGQSSAVALNGYITPHSGMDRRVILVDGSGSNLDEAGLVEQGKTSLAEARRTAMFDGSINQDLSPYVYGVDYRLGDKVHLVGDYGLDSVARVTEYIRSEDANGVKSYPTLVKI